MVQYLKELRHQSVSNKESRINFNKIVAYLDLLEEYGTRIGEPVTKHLEGEIWELRPLRNRFLYAYYKKHKFIILHHFIKKTKKTPKREIEQAKKKFPFIEAVITDYKVALADEEVEAVYVLTPNYSHYTITMDALRAGKHVFCEKPITVNYELSCEMAEEA